jgi:hypothetical protein
VVGASAKFSGIELSFKPQLQSFGSLIPKVIPFCDNTGRKGHRGWIGIHFLCRGCLCYGRTDDKLNFKQFKQQLVRKGVKY